MHFSIRSFPRVLLCFLFELTLIFSIGVGLSVPVAQAREGPCPVGPNPQWTGIEKQVWGTICRGQQAVLTQTSKDKSVSVTQVIRKQFLEEILRDPKYKKGIGTRGVHITGAQIEDEIDLSYATLSYPLELVKCRFDKAVILRGLRTTHHVSFNSSAFLADLDLSEIRLEGQLDLPFGIFQGVRLQHAHVDGPLELSHSTFNGVLQMSGMETGTSVFLEDAMFKGNLDLHASYIGRDLSIHNSFFLGVLNLDGTHIRGSARLGGQRGSLDGSSEQVTQMHFKKVDFYGARIDQALHIDASVIEDELMLSGLRVGDTLTIIRTEVTKAKTIDIKFSDLGSLVILQSAFHSLDLTGTVIHKKLALGSNKWAKDARLTMRGTETKSLNDKVDSWPDVIDLRGFVYADTYALGTGSDDFTERDVEWFKGWLSKQAPYSPQPYKQLASVLQSAGHRLKAEEILIEGKERERASSASPTLLTFQKYFIGYGYRSISYPLRWASGFAVAGGLFLFFFQNPFKPPHASPPSSLLPLFLERQLPGRWSSVINQFCAILVYSLDRFLPVVRLREHISPSIQPSGWLSYWFHFQHLMGYVVTAFFIAGLSGLVER